MLGKREPVLHAKSGVACALGSARPEDAKRTRQFFLAVITASTAFLLLYAHLNPLRYDEVLTYYTVDHASFRELLHFQRTTPIVLEPPAFDIVLWLTSKIFGLHVFALRLPGLLSFVLMQTFVFALLRRFSLLAACLGVLFFLPCSIVSFGPEIRPYGFLLLCTAALLWLWQQAVTCEIRRGWALWGMAATVLLAATSQFYGVLIVAAVIAGELVRLFNGGKRNLRVWGALGAAIPAMALDVPFVHAVSPYQQFLVLQEHFNAGTLVATYVVLMKANLRMSSPAMGVLVFALVIIAIPLCCVLTFPRRRETANDAVRRTVLQPLWAAFCFLALLPGLVLAIAHSVTHTYSPRHSISCAIGIFSLAAIGVSRGLLKLRNSWRTPVIAVLVLMLAVAAGQNLRGRAYALRTVEAANRPAPAVVQMLHNDPGTQLYLTVDVCLMQAMYGDPAVRSRERCLYSRDREILYSHQVIVELTAKALAQGTSFPLQPVPYEAFHGAGHGLLVYHDEDWERWIPASLQADGARVQPLGTGFGGDIDRVIFP